MAFLLKANNAKSTINMEGGLPLAETTLVVADGSLFPATGDFLLTIWDKATYPDPGDDPGMEIVRCTARTGNSLTIARGQEDTDDIAHDNGEAVEMLITAGVLNESLDQDVKTTDSPQFAAIEIMGAAQVGEQVLLTEIETPSPPAAGKIRLYAKDMEGESALCVLDSEGVETALFGAGGGGAVVLDALLDVTVTAHTSGFTLVGDGLQYVGRQLSHTELGDVGNNDHAAIDEHIADKANPHEVTAAQAGAVGLTGDEQVAGQKSLTSWPILPSGSPTADRNPATKAYADAIALGMSWKDPVLDKDLTAPPAEPQTGDCYIVGAGATGAWENHDNEIAEWLGAEWAFDTPSLGWALLVMDESNNYWWDGEAWIYIRASEVYAAGPGMLLVGNEFRARPDDASVEISADKIAIKAAGVDPEHLSGGIPDSKLATIETAEKVGWGAVNKAGSALNDIANINAAAPADGQALVWNQASGKWIPAAVAGPGAGGGDLYLTIPLLASGPTRWYRMPAAETELFDMTAYRLKMNLAAISQYRLLVGQTVAGYAGADLNLQYSTNGTDFVAADTAAAGELDVGAGTGLKVGEWADLQEGAKGEVWLRLVGKDGGGNVSPYFTEIHLQLKAAVGSGDMTKAVYDTDDDGVIDKAALPADTVYEDGLPDFDDLAPTTTKGDIIARGEAANERIAGNTAAAKKFLAQTGDGENSALPSWEGILSGDLPTHSHSSADLPANQKLADIVIPLVGEVSDKEFCRVSFACTIKGWTLLAMPGESGSIQLDIWKEIYANWPPTVEDSIVASAPPAIVTGTKAEDTTLSGWTTAIAAGDTLVVNVDSVSDITRAVLILHVERS